MTVCAVLASLMASGKTVVVGRFKIPALRIALGQLNPVAPDDMKKLAALGLKNDFDLRAAGEREAKPDQLPAGVKNVWLNVLADAKGINPAD